jgi:hypothetical protein
MGISLEKRRKWQRPFGTGDPAMEKINLGTNAFVYPMPVTLVGANVAAYSEERYLSDGQPDVHKINPLVLTMPDNRYWTVGEYVGKAWGEGKKWKRLQAG